MDKDSNYRNINLKDVRRINMKEKGFTLIEILAVIIVIAIISLITIPIIVNTIEKSKKNALVDSAYGILKAGNLYYMEEMSKKEETERYDFKVSDGKFVLEKDNTKTLKFTGKVPKTGILQIHPNGNSAIGICTDTYCACKSVSELKVTLKDTTCNINSETGEITDNKDAFEERVKALEESKVELEKKVIALEQNKTALQNQVNTLEKKKVMPGTVISYLAGTSVPEGYLACDGKVYNVSAYSDLANAIKSGFGRYNYYGGNGSTTFAVPDLRGEFLRGTGTNGHANQGSGSSVGTHQDGTEMPSIWSWGPSFGIYTSTNNSNGDNARPVKYDSTVKTVSYYMAAGSKYTEEHLNYPSLYTSRPTNTSVLYAIKY